MSLKERTIRGIFWSFIQNFSTQIIALVIGIVLARILSPREFGLIGMLTIFIALSNALITSGIIDALIRDPEVEDTDYSTAFIFNVCLSVVVYIILFAGAPLISNFFEEPLLKPMVRVLCLSLVINAFMLVQRARLIKSINFKLLAKIDTISVLLSGLFAIGMAWYGFGVWSLVAKTILLSFFTVLFCWTWSKWRPQVIFDKSSFKKMFSFGSKLALIGMIDTLFLNMYYLIIGKQYSASQLGFYTQAERFKNFPSKGITGIVQQVTYPVLSEIQSDTEKLKKSYQKLIKIVSLITITLLVGLASISKNLVILLLGEEWLVSGEYLTILCFVAISYPLSAMNMNIMKVKGKSGLVLNLGLLKKITTIPIILAAIFISIKSMLLVMVGQQFIVFCINAYFGGNLIQYKFLEQLSDVFPAIFVSVLMFILISVVSENLALSPLSLIPVQVLTGIIFSVSLYKLLKVDGFILIQKEVQNKLIKS